MSLALIGAACQITPANTLGMIICTAAPQCVTRQVSVKGCRAPARRHHTGMPQAPCTARHQCQASGMSAAQKISSVADSGAQVSTGLKSLSAVCNHSCVLHDPRIHLRVARVSARLQSAVSKSCHHVAAATFVVATSYCFHSLVSTTSCSCLDTGGGGMLVTDQVGNR